MPSAVRIRFCLSPGRIRSFVLWLARRLKMRTMPIEPVILTVSQVRAAIAAAEPAREPAPVNALTGGMFHAVAARVLSPDTAESWQALTPEDVASPPAIQRHLYHRLLAPRLHRSRAALQGGSEEVRYLWRAVQSFSD